MEKISKEEYINKRKEFKEWCTKEKERQEREKEEKMYGIRTE